MKTAKKILAMLMSLSMLVSFGMVVVSASDVKEDYVIYPTADEIKQQNIEAVRKAASEAKEDEIMIMFVICADKKTALKYFETDDNVVNMFSYEDIDFDPTVTATETYVSIIVQPDDVEKYITIYENDEKITSISYAPDVEDEDFSDSNWAFEIGDINIDKIVDMSDLVEVSLYLLGENELSEIQLKAADVTADGKVDLTDLATIKQYVSKQINSFM